MKTLDEWFKLNHFQVILIYQTLNIIIIGMVFANKVQDSEILNPVSKMKYGI